MPTNKRLIHVYRLRMSSTHILQLLSIVIADSKTMMNKATQVETLAKLELSNRGTPCSQPARAYVKPGQITIYANKFNLHDVYLISLSRYQLELRRTLYVRDTNKSNRSFKTFS